MRLLNMEVAERPGSGGSDASQLVHVVNLKLAALGCAPVESHSDEHFQEVARAILNQTTEADAGDALAPVDARIQAYLDRTFGAGAARMPAKTLVLDRPGLARALSIPFGGHEFSSSILSSYRVRQGVLHNPKSDRRTTQGIFHVAEGGLPVPDDKISVPKEVFAKMFNLALLPPRDLLKLPFTAGETRPAEVLVSLLLRPVVCPSVPKFSSFKTMEIRFFAPGSLVSNLDFVETIFGNGGDPYAPRNNAALDVYHWTGHSGCVVLAPHLVHLTKRELGLPGFHEATERQREDGMCWRDPAEKYNNGNAFKLTSRDASGVMVTIIADNYFGYCKKEVKTQISFSANLYGNCEEEHAGGALVYPSYDLGEEFSAHLHLRRLGYSFEEMFEMYRGAMDLHPEGYATDKHHPHIVYVPDEVNFDLRAQTVSWERDGKPQSLPLRAGKYYVRPSGYKIHMEKVPGTKNWRLVGTVAEGLLCHKPCTVSGGGKSEISKSIADAIIQGPIFVTDFQKDFDQVAALIKRDYSDRFKDTTGRHKDSRSILSHKRSLGSVIKLLTPSEAEYTEEFNAWLESIPQYLKELVFVVKRFYKPEWGEQWREHFSVDTINGTPGNELKFQNRKLATNYLRVGYETDGSWRVFGLRKDFHPAAKISMEDDITASVVVPPFVLPNQKNSGPSAKFVLNCESRLFQRPDDAIHRGYDKQTEADFAQPGNFFSNYEPLGRKDAQALVEDAIGFEQFTPPMQGVIRAASQDDRFKYFIGSAHPRVIDGKPSKNPRYLQLRPDLGNPEGKYLAEMATRLFRRIPLNEPVLSPVGAVVPGRRNNPPDAAARIRPLAVYNPIHYMELPELFMEYISSMTGKSPSTTGAGSEGALTKGPFNALPAIYDLNAALVSYLLTSHHGFVTAAGYVGPKTRVDHDVSLLIPELWSRMDEEERDPAQMMREGYLEKCEDFEHEGKPVLASRLGYRITKEFVIHYFGRVFNHPHVVFTQEMLRPELQDMAVFADGMDNIVSTHQRVAEHYFKDGTIQFACPPLKALLQIMSTGAYEGKTLADPGVRSLFTREHLLASGWYRDRLQAKQRVDIALWKRHLENLEQFVFRGHHSDEEYLLVAEDRLMDARAHLQRVSSATYIEELVGALGAEPSLAPTL
jgi:phosphoenolpyruvate carboxykinase (diphosphate)